MDLVINELSFQYSLPNSEEEAMECLEALSRTLQTYRLQLGLNKLGILAEESFKQYLLLIKNEGQVAEAHIYFEELFKRAKNKTSLRLLLSAFSSKPKLKKLPSLSAYKLKKELPFYTYKEGEAEPEIVGFAYAYEQALYAVSYNNSIWNKTEYNILKIEEEGEEVTETEVTVNHFLESSSVDAFKLLRTGRNLWDWREIIFPNLVFCGDTETQICDLSLKNKDIQIAYDKLKVLDEGLEGKRIEDFDYKSLGITISGESKSTKQQYGDLRTFAIPGTEREELFELHIKSGDWRYHFFLDKETNKCYIGYIGKKLRTKKYKT